MSMNFHMNRSIQSCAWRRNHTSVHERRTALDWVEEIKYLVNVMYPDAERIILVMNNLEVLY